MFTFVEGHHFKTTGTSCKEKPIHSTNNGNRPKEHVLHLLHMHFWLIF